MTCNPPFALFRRLRLAVGIADDGGHNADTLDHPHPLTARPRGRFQYFPLNPRHHFLGRGRPNPRVEVYEPAQIFGKTAEELHGKLTTTRAGETTGHLETPGSRYGRNSQECAWYAVAALAVYSADAHEPEDAEAFLEYVMGRVVNDDEEIAAFLREYEDRIPEEVKRQIDLSKAGRPLPPAAPLV